MSQRSLLWPVAVIAIMLVMVFSALAAPSSNPAALPTLQYPYPAAATNTPQSTDTPAPTESPTPSTTTTAGTATASPTGTEAPSPSAVNTVAPANAPSMTPTPTLGPEVEVLNCAPGVPVMINGDEAPPLTPLLLFFDQRAVGGGISDNQGQYRLRLVPGEERPGLYDVTVQVRDTRDIVRELVCEVVGTPPTPTELVVSPTVEP